MTHMKQLLSLLGSHVTKFITQHKLDRCMEGYMCTVVEGYYDTTPQNDKSHSLYEQLTKEEVAFS